MSRRTGIVGFVVLVAVLIVGGFLAVDRLAGEQETATVIDKPELGTYIVTATDLVERETFAGVLRYANPQIVSTAVAGTVTAVATEGATLTRGDVIVEIDGRAVALFFGDRPMWRTLAIIGTDLQDVVGPDVFQLEANLTELGYPSVRDDEDAAPEVSEPDNEFDEDTERLIEDWRSDIGLSEADFVEVGRIVYQPGDVRVSRILAQAGTLLVPGAPIVEVSSTEQEVFVQLPVDKRELVAEGDAVRVTLPDDRVVGATIVSVGSVVSFVSEDSPGVIEVSIRLDNPDHGAGFDQSPVDVEIIANEESDVLAVPVNALLALAEGGYALEVDRGSETTLVSVETGIYVDGLVEVSGEISAGDTVIVPK